jgi:hypothetical protein
VYDRPRPRAARALAGGTHGSHPGNAEITRPRHAGNAGAPSFARMGAMRDLLDRLGRPGATANAGAAAARREAELQAADALAARMAERDERPAD